jgi:Ca2+:H+ antiporter
LTEKRVLSRFHILDLFLIFVPVSVIFYYLKLNSILVFVTTALATAGIAHLLAESTGIIAERVSTTLSALMNATFGNAIEFMIAIFALRNGLVELVKASITGSIMINVLSLIGFSMLVGGLKYKEQKFNKDSAGLSSTMLIIAVVGLALPSLYNMVVGKPDKEMNYAAAIIMGVIYVLSLIYSFGTHRHLFVVERQPPEKTVKGRWTLRTAVIVLLVATAIAGLESNILVESITPVVSLTGISETFMGLVFVAVLTNIPEHASAMTFARRNNMTLSLEIGMSSALQIALFVVPVLVLVSGPLTGTPLDLVFGPFEIAAVLITAMIANYIGSDGICHWVEGVQLIAVYLLIAVAFFFI